MNCETASELIEPLAAEDIELTSELRAHLDTCPRCTAELQVACRIHASLLSGRAHAPRHFTATVLQRLPAQHTWSLQDGMETMLDSALALSVAALIVGIWFLADPALLRETNDAIGAAFSRGSRVLLQTGTVLSEYVAVATAAVIVVMGMSSLDQT
jgi:hypothetical protein